jgi:hypothetical protein
LDTSLLGWVPDLTRYGIEPNPGPVVFNAGRGQVVKSGKKVRGKKQSTAARSLAKSVARLVLAPKRESRSLGERIGGWVGDKAQKAIMAITGFGDYTVVKNSITGGSGGTPPMFTSDRPCTKIRHREFVALVQSPGSTFNINAYSINPLSSFFPWLSEISGSFEQFAVRGMVVEFKSTSATAVASTNTALGSVILATQYNVLAPAFTTQQQMEAYQYCTSCAPSVSMIHPIECDPSQNTISELFVDVYTSGDPRLSIMGTTYIATVGQQAASTIGELWVSYDIDFFRPKLFSGISNPGLGFHWSSGSSVLSSNLLSPQYQNDLNTVSAGSDLPVVFAGGSSLRFPGNLACTLLITGSFSLSNSSVTFGTWTTATVSSGSALIRTNYFGSGAASQVAAPNLVAANTPFQVSWQFMVGLSGSNPSVPVVVNCPIPTGGACSYSTIDLIAVSLPFSS